jgi:DNA-directed RNA polymerase specialized sigma subunit
MSKPPERYDNFDDYIEDRLAEWGEWLGTGNSLGIGYSSQSILALIHEGKIISRSKNFGAVLETNERAEEIENLVAQMAQYKFEMAQALRLYYIDSLSLRRSAKKLGVSYSHYHLYVQMAKQWLIGRLSAE